MSDMTYFLKTKRLRYDKTIQDMAKYLKICSKSYSLKENGVREWTLSELVKIKKVLKIDDNDMIKIFFKQKSTKCE